MIGSEGFYYFDCSIADFNDFIEYEDTFSFKISEFAGGILPEFDMTFVTSEQRITPYLHEGSIIKAKLGRTRETVKNMTLYCTSWVSGEHGTNYRIFNVKGFAVNIDYVNSPVIKSYTGKSAVEAVIECAKTVFGSKVISNITKSFDSQNWYQPNITNKNFITKTLYRADLKTSFPAFAITMDGTFILKDIIKDLSNKNTDWYFVKSRREVPLANEVQYVGDANVVSNVGIVNKIIGYNFDFKSMVIETEEIVSELFKRKNILVPTSKLGGSKTANPKQVVGIQQTENVHENYHKSYNHNLINLLNLSCTEVPFTVFDPYFDIKPLDKARFYRTGVTKSVGDKQSTFSDDYSSGDYFVTNIVRQIENKKFLTTVKISRETTYEVRDAT